MAETQRPPATFMLGAYNQERFVREAVEGALSQDYSPLQVLLSDDGSTDRTLEIMQEIVAAYTGPHTVVLNRNSPNLGIGRHVNKLMELATGELIVVAAGDDVSAPSRVSALVAAWVAAGKRPDLMSSRYAEIDAHGTELSVKDSFEPRFLEPAHMARIGRAVVGCSEAWTRRLWDRFGPLPDHIVNEDRVVTFRAVLAGGVGYVPEPLVRRRVGFSTWITRDGADAAQVQRRFRTLARFDIDVARVAYDDAAQAGRADMERLLRARVAESDVIDRIFSGTRPKPADVASAVRDGASLKRILRAVVVEKQPRLYVGFASVKARLGRGRA